MNCRDFKRILLSKVDKLEYVYTSKEMKAHLTECEGCTKDFNELMYSNNAFKSVVGNTTVEFQDNTERIIKNITERNSSSRNTRANKARQALFSSILLALILLCVVSIFKVLHLEIQKNSFINNSVANINTNLASSDDIIFSNDNLIIFVSNKTLNCYSYSKGLYYSIDLNALNIDKSNDRLLINSSPNGKYLFVSSIYNNKNIIIDTSNNKSYTLDLSLNYNLKDLSTTFFTNDYVINKDITKWSDNEQYVAILTDYTNSEYSVYNLSDLSADKGTKTSIEGGELKVSNSGDLITDTYIFTNYKLSYKNKQLVKNLLPSSDNNKPVTTAVIGDTIYLLYYSISDKTTTLMDYKNGLINKVHEFNSSGLENIQFSRVSNNTPAQLNFEEFYYSYLKEIYSLNTNTKTLNHLTLPNKFIGGFLKISSSGKTLLNYDLDIKDSVKIINTDKPSIISKNGITNLSFYIKSLAAIKDDSNIVFVKNSSESGKFTIIQYNIDTKENSVIYKNY